MGSSQILPAQCARSISLTCRLLFYNFTIIFVSDGEQCGPLTESSEIIVHCLGRIHLSHSSVFRCMRVCLNVCDIRLIVKMIEGKLCKLNVCYFYGKSWICQSMLYFPIKSTKVLSPCNVIILFFSCVIEEVT